MSVGTVFLTQNLPKSLSASTISSNMGWWADTSFSSSSSYARKSSVRQSAHREWVEHPKADFTNQNCRGHPWTILWSAQYIRKIWSSTRQSISVLRRLCRQGHLLHRSIDPFDVAKSTLSDYILALTRKSWESANVRTSQFQNRMYF